MFPDSLGWDRDDYVALLTHAVSGEFEPEHWLQFCTIESGLLIRRADPNDPKDRGSGTFARNPDADARGLFQALPVILKNLGYSGGDFRELRPAAQIFWSYKYLDEWRNRFKFQQWDRAGDMYLCNFTPAFLPYKDVPSKVIFSYDKNPKAYRVNAGLDQPQAGYKCTRLFGRDCKGFINVADMTLAADRALSNANFKQAVRSLNKLVQTGLNDRGYGEGMNKTGKGPLVVDGDLGFFSKQALAKFWEDKAFPAADRKLDRHTRFSLL